MSAGKSSHSGKLTKVTAEWTYHPPGTVYRCEARLAASAGSLVATAPAYPELSASAEDERGAFDALRDKLAGEIRRRKAAGEALPSGGAHPKAAGDTVRWLTVRL